MLAIALVVGAVGLVIGGLGALLKHEPEFYIRPGCPDEFVASEQAARLITRVQDLKNDIRLKPTWAGTLRADELNSFFREHMADGGGFAGALPAGCHDPRVAIDGDRLKFGVRYGRGIWSTVLWVELRAWLVKTEPNCLAVELTAIRSGSIPVNSQAVLDAITEAARDSNIDVSWYRTGGRPVGLFRFYADQLRPTTQILSFKIENGAIIVGGKSQVDPTVSGTEAVR
jgi:hypothetical protein